MEKSVLTSHRPNEKTKWHWKIRTSEYSDSLVNNQIFIEYKRFSDKWNYKGESFFWLYSQIENYFFFFFQNYKITLNHIILDNLSIKKETEKREKRIAYNVLVHGPSHTQNVVNLSKLYKKSFEFLSILLSSNVWAK